MKSVDLAILNYKGRKHLEHLLPTALAEAGRYIGTCRVVVVDNQSGKEEEVWVRENFPEVVFWAAPRNDFLFSYNDFARASEAEIVLLLNNDLKLKPEFIAPLVRHFEDNDVFAVGATSRDWDDQEYTCGPSHLTRAHGSYRWVYDRSSQHLQHTFFTSGGFMAVDRMKFLELGGFDPMYRPAYCEDVDLCFRAWRRGWCCVFEPLSVAIHRETGSWDGAGARRLSRMLLRNSLLFQWSSLPMQKRRLQRWWSIIKVSLGTLMEKDAGWLKTFAKTLLEWPGRGKADRMPPVTEEELADIQERINAPITRP